VEIAEFHVPYKLQVARIQQLQILEFQVRISCVFLWRKGIT